jgi:hypothetical protein
MKRSFRWHSRENLLSRFASLTMLALAIGIAALVGYAQQGTQNLSGTSGGGGVHGSISAQLKVQIGPESAGATVIRDLALPDFEVFLQNVDTGETSQPVSTDLMGRYVFPTQKPGSYQLHWKQQGGWQEGVLDKQIAIANNTAYPGRAEVKPVAGQGLVVGQLKRADGKPTWVYEEFFGLNLTPKVEALDANGKSVGGPVRANVGGQFAIAGLPQTSLQLQAKIEAAVAVQTIPATAISLDGSVSPVTMTFNEHGPEIVAVEAKAGEKVVRTVAPGAKIVVAVVARSQDEKALTFDWRLPVGMGTLNSSGTSAEWTLPAETGPYLGYVAVSDGFGGYAVSSFGVLVGSAGTAPSGEPLQSGAAAGQAGGLPETMAGPVNSTTTTCLKVVLDDTALKGDPSVTSLVGATVKATDMAGNPVGVPAPIGPGQHFVELTGLPANTDLKLSVTFNTTPSPGVIFESAPRSPLPDGVVHTAASSGDCQAVKLTQYPVPASVFNSFLNYVVGAGTNAGAMSYYALVDPTNERQNLRAWWIKNGFGPNGHIAGEVHTSYLNNNDLGSGRDMHVLNHNGIVSAYVTNYVDMTNGPHFNQNPSYADSAAAQDPTRRAATVCMEWSPTDQVVKFFVYQGNGNGPTAPISPSLNLDGSTPDRFVPNLCTSCHGGFYNPNAPTANLGAYFREFDLATFKFQGGRDVPNDEERAAFKQQNLIVRGGPTDVTLSSQATKNLVNGWYGISQTYVDPHPAFTGQYSNWFPPGMAATGWDDPPGASSDTRTSHRYLYRTVVAQSCRTCHVAFPNIDWTTFDQLDNEQKAGSIVPAPSFIFSSTLDSGPTPPNPTMPHSFVTYKNFWSSRNPSEAQILTNFTGW